MGLLKRLKSIHNALIKACRSWALKEGFDPEGARELRHAAILINHRGYIENIPAYRKLAQEEGCDKSADIPTIKKKLMSSDDVFKSYNQDWIDSGDYNKMNRWLSNLYYKPIKIDVSNITSLDVWIERLGKAGVSVSYSSGTSGMFSFVPRDPEDWKQAKVANTNYLAPLLTYGKTGTFFHSSSVKTGPKVALTGYFLRRSRENRTPQFRWCVSGLSPGKNGEPDTYAGAGPGFSAALFFI
jgi:hypothetical protein